MAMWQRLFRELEEQRVCKYDDEVVSILFEVLDRDLSTMISRSEFRGLLSLIDLKFTLKPDWMRERSEFRKQIVQVLQYDHTEDVLDLLVYANSILLIASFYNQSEQIGLALNFFLLFFVIELATKLYAYGPTQFLKRDVFNQVDFIAIFGGVVMFFVTTAYDTSIDRKTATAARLFRGVRVLRGLRGFKSMLVVFGFAFKGFLTYLAAIFVMFYMYAVIGMELFGERIGTREQMCCQTDDPANCELSCAEYEAVLATSYGQSHYWRINFNTLGSSLFALFYLMIVNNWPVIVEGYVAAVGSKTLWPRWYFYLWYIIMVLVMMNIVQAFLLNSFLTQQLYADQQSKRQEEKAQERDFYQGEMSSLESSLPPCCLERLLCRKGVVSDEEGQNAEAGGERVGRRRSVRNSVGRKRGRDSMSRLNKTTMKLPLWQMLLYSTAIRKSKREQGENGEVLSSSAYNLFTKYHIRKTAHFADLQENLLLDQSDVNKLEQLLSDKADDQIRQRTDSSESAKSDATADSEDDERWSVEELTLPDTIAVDSSAAAVEMSGTRDWHNEARKQRAQRDERRPISRRGSVRRATKQTRGACASKGDGINKRIQDFTQAGLQRPRGSSIGDELGIAQAEMEQIMQLGSLQKARTKVGRHRFSMGWTSFPLLCIAKLTIHFSQTLA
jgi:two pore calcium channel protein 3